MEKSYEKVIEYVKKGIGSGEIQAGEKLLPERELAQKLEISRNSAREGLRILENMGVLESQQGAGNSPEILMRSSRRCSHSCSS